MTAMEKIEALKLKLEVTKEYTKIQKTTSEREIKEEFYEKTLEEINDLLNTLIRTEWDS